MNVVLAKAETGRALSDVFALARDRLPGAGKIAEIRRQAFEAYERAGLPFSYAFTNNSAAVNFVGDPTNPANYFTNPNNNPAQIEGRPVIVNGTRLNAAQIGGLDYSVTTDRDIFGGVVGVDVKVTGRLYRQIEPRVAGQAVQHVVKKPDAGRNVGVAGPVDVQRNRDGGLAGLAANLGGPAGGRARK